MIRKRGAQAFLGVIRRIDDDVDLQIADQQSDQRSDQRSDQLRHGVATVITADSVARTATTDRATANSTSPEATEKATVEATTRTQRRYELIADQYPDVFEEIPGLPPERDTQHRTELEADAKPPFRPMIRMSPADLEESRKQIAEFMEKMHVRDSKSPYSAPVIFVRKKEGDLRMCIDYRALNKQTIKDRYPMPRIDDLMDQLLSAKVFTKLDLKTVLEQLRKHKLYAKRSKCTFGMPEVEYLGHIVGKHGVRMDDTKVNAIKKWPVP